MFSVLQKRIKAGALQYTIFIGVVIALLVFAFISLSYIQNTSRIKTTFFKDVVHTANESFNLSDYKTITYNTPTHLPVYSSVETILTKKPWGFFDILSVTATLSDETFTKTALIGGWQTERPALYLADDNQPLVVVGNTYIAGKTFLPEREVKRGSIGGKSYLGSQFVYGQVFRSDKKLPEISTPLDYEQILTELIIPNNNNFLELTDFTKIIHRFSEPSKIISSDGVLFLDDVTLYGNIIVYSDFKIIVKASSSLKDIILIAPEIVIEDKVIGSFQAFSNKKISVGKNCILNYPSVLVLSSKEKLPSKKEEEQLGIFVEKGTTIRGAVMCLIEDTTDSFQTNIVFEDQSNVIGEVYCEGNTELKGTVKGSLYSKGFIANASGAVYKNHIFNGNILGNNLPEQYCGISFKNSQTKVAKWLNY